MQIKPYILQFIKVVELTVEWLCECNQPLLLQKLQDKDIVNKSTNEAHSYNKQDKISKMYKTCFTNKKTCINHK